jgi:protein SHQ1
MLTPLFSLTQDDLHVTLVLRVPYMKASTMDYYISGPEFKFYAKPYYLRLTFPHMLAEGGNEKTQYDVDKGELTLILQKLVAGKLQRYNTFSSFIP